MIRLSLRRFPQSVLPPPSSLIHARHATASALQFLHPPALPSLPARRPDSFDALHLHPAVRDALVAIDRAQPTNIQILAAPPLLAGKDAVIAAETGAGKTIAYLAPLLSSLKQSELQSGLPTISPLFSSLSMRPSILVLVPTRELSGQVLAVAKQLAHVAKFSARGAIGGAQRTPVRRRLSQTPMDVLVCTPGCVFNMRKQNLLHLSKVRVVVLDEADELVSPTSGFGDQLQELMNTLRKKEAQFVYVGATVPAAMEQRLQKWHKNGVEVVRSKQLHRAAPSSRVKTIFIRVDGGEDAKIRKLVEIFSVSRHRTGAGKFLIFCDDVKRREAVVEVLRKRGTDVVHLSGEGRKREERSLDWKAFECGEVMVAVCSKSFGRGIDDTEIRTVILVDVPMTGSEYLHRIGRIRGQGRVYVLVGRREEAIAENLFLAHVRGEQMTRVSPKQAWAGYTGAGRDRIATDGAVKNARGKGHARWVDERRSAEGTFRGRKGSKGSEME